MATSTPRLDSNDTSGMRKAHSKEEVDAAIATLKGSGGGDSRAQVRLIKRNNARLRESLFLI